MQFSKEIQQPTSMDSGFFGFKTGLQMHTESSQGFHSQLSQTSDKSQKIEDFEKACSQPMFATAKGDAVEITAQHLERVLKIFDDSDEEEPFEIEQSSTGFGSDPFQKAETGGFFLASNVFNQGAQLLTPESQMSQNTEGSFSGAKLKTEDLDEVCKKLKEWNTSKRTIRVLKNAPDCKGKKVSRIHKIQTGCGFMREIPEVCDINEEEEEEKIISTGTKLFKLNKTQFGTYKTMTFFQQFDNDTNSLPELYDEEKENVSQAFESFPLELSSTKQTFEPKKTQLKRNFMDLESKASKMNELKL